MDYHLISSVTCPWVQRSVIVMRTKGIDFKVTYINLRDKPDWFLEISPHGKVPVLVVDEQPLFESNAIAEFLDETAPPRLHPADPVKRARNRAWTDFLPDFAASISGLNYCKSEDAFDDALELARKRLERVEHAIAEERGNDGPFFNGPDLSLVDAAYAPFLQRFDFIEDKRATGLLGDFPLVQAWSDALLADDRISGSVPANFRKEFIKNLHRRECLAAALFAA
ncbi:MAG: glutathione S-transferase family protein [Gammaproteobacteria bacterium]|nr:glutathione S-transferase family protein [Gammaproteobacteria bacterium]